MSKKTDIFSARNVFFATLFFAAAVLTFLAPKAAVNVDEQLHYPHAKKVVNWYFTAGEDGSCLETPISNLKYYGQSVDNFSALVNRVFNIEDEFLARHYIGALFFWLLLLFAAMIAYQLTGSFWVAGLTVISMMVMPRLFGQAFGNLKDIPFATGYTAGIYMIIRFVKELPKPKWTTAIYLGISIAFTCSVRIGGLLLFAFLGLAIVAYIILKPFFLKQIVSTKHHLVRLLGQGLLIVFIGYFLGLLFWPFALRDVFYHPMESLSVMEHYKVSIRQIFEGELIWSTQLPWYYLPKWLAISTPGFIFLGLIYYLIFFVKNSFRQYNRQLFFELFVGFTLLFPLVYVIIIGSNLYSGVRQMLFVLPFFAIFSSIGIVNLLRSKAIKSVKFVAAFFYFSLMTLPIKHQAATFPADYIYFNEISGGNKNSWANYEYDYYFHGIKESSEYLLELVGEEEVVVVSNCNLSNYFENVPNIKYQFSRYLERSSVDWDYGLFGVNYIHPYQLKNETWQSSQIVKTFYHKGSPIAVLLKRSNKNDFVGISELKNRNFDIGEQLIKQAIKSDSNNVWLFVHLAKVCFEKNEFDEFERFLKSGFKLHPFYEPLYLLKAQKNFNDKKYDKSLEILEQLIEINPRYKNAAPLLEAVKEKLDK
jgi:tetratricopeptide (TPR) repeat protein